jgi:hypothetical protein
METLWQDLKYGFRMLTKSPGFAAISVLTLALGIGANAQVRNFYDRVLAGVRALPEVVSAGACEYMPFDESSQTDAQSASSALTRSVSVWRLVLRPEQ